MSLFDGHVASRWLSRSSWSWLAAVSAAIVVPAVCQAQTIQTRSVTLADAVTYALDHYPSIREVRARVEAADASVDVARTAYIPRLDLLWQTNRATTNNVFGLLFPQAVVPPISGPVLGTTSFDSVWGTAAGALLSWDVVDFGLRRAGVQAARAQTAAARAQSDLTQLDVASAAADAFLTVLAADETVRAARANVDRLQVFADAVRTLVTNQLRPGADQSRAEAELAIARTQVSQATQAAEIARATLAEAMGTADARIEPTIGRLGEAPQVATPGADSTSHPAVRAQFATVETFRARERVLDRAYLPHISFQSAFAGRGTGAEVPGQPSLGSGLGLHVPNWAVGGSVTFSALDWFNVRARKRVEVANAAAEQARYDRVLQTVTTQQVRARALLTAAREIAQNTPVELRAARDAESRARARYDSGLASVTEVAEAQRLLTQAEADDALARLGLWRAFLANAQAQGSLQSFLDQVR
jgi:outer membrane protein TolC